MLARSIVGSPDTVREGLAALFAETGADELMVVSDIYDHGTRLHSYELIAAAHASNARERRVRPIDVSALEGERQPEALDDCERP
jgi:hypothetical protein